MYSSQEGLSKEVTFEPERRGRHHVVYVAEGMVAKGMVAGMEREVSACCHSRRGCERICRVESAGARRGGQRQSSKAQANGG